MTFGLQTSRQLLPSHVGVSRTDAGIPFGGTPGYEGTCHFRQFRVGLEQTIFRSATSLLLRNQPQDKEIRSKLQ